MSGLGSWALTVCAAAVISAVFELLIPDRKYERLLRPVIAAFAVCAVLAPAAAARESCSAGTGVYQADEPGGRLRETVERQAADIVRSAVASEIKRAVDGIVPGGCSVDVSVETGEDGALTVTGASLTVGGSFAPSESVIKERASAASGLGSENITVNFE